MSVLGLSLAFLCYFSYWSEGWNQTEEEESSFFPNCVTVAQGGCDWQLPLRHYYSTPGVGNSFSQGATGETGSVIGGPNQ